MEKAHFVRIALAAAAVVALSACERQPSPAPAGGSGSHAHDDGHDHDHDHADHADDGHAHEGEHGDGAALGAVEAGGFTVTVRLAGELTPGEEVSVDIEIVGPGEPGALRVWVGREDGRGSMKARAEREGHGYHAHVEVPEPLPEGSRLWIEVEPSSGEASVVSLPISP